MSGSNSVDMGVQRRDVLTRRETTDLRGDGEAERLVAIGEGRRIVER